MKVIDVYGKAEKEICSGCEHECSGCTPGDKRKTIDLVKEFEELLSQSELKNDYIVNFFEATKENILKNEDVEKLLSMAELDPVICLDKKVTYLGGFSPQGLLDELRKKN